MNNVPNNLTNKSPANISNLDMMRKIAGDRQNLDDIQMLTSSKVTDQLKVFLIAQARNELQRVVKLTTFLDRIEDKFIDKVNNAMINDELTLRQYSDIIDAITALLSRSNDIISKVLKDDSLTMIMNTTIYQSGTSSSSSAIIANLRDARSREKVRNIIDQVLNNTKSYSEQPIETNYEEGGTQDE